jgi:lipoprotein-anchoring transpeptidase ErfK/SrfK
MNRTKYVVLMAIFTLLFTQLFYNRHTHNAYAAKTDEPVPPVTPVTSVVNLIVISKSQNQLRAFAGNQVVVTFSVATGRHGCTPKGNFSIINKSVNPGKSALGSRWMGLNKVGRSGRRYGIHGTNNPDSIGKWQSAGCVRLHNENAKKIFDITPVGTAVIITDEKLPDNPPGETAIKN